MVKLDGGDKFESGVGMELDYLLVTRYKEELWQENLDEWRVCSDFDETKT